MKKHLFYTFIAIFTCFAVQLTAFAAESTDEISNMNYEISSETDSAIVPYGSLSGYASHAHHSGDALECSFPIQVSGSWSPFAGWTVKTNFSNNSCRISYVYLTRPDGTKIGDTLYPNANDELKNKALYNVPTGTYTVHYALSTRCDGNIQVYIY